MAKSVKSNPLKVAEAEAEQVQDTQGGEAKAERQYNVSGVVISESALNLVLSVLIKLPWDAANSSIDYIKTNAKLQEAQA